MRVRKRPVTRKLLNLNKAFSSGLKHHQQGRLKKAKELYEKILRIHPNHPDSLHFLGLIQGQQGNKESAENFLRRAIEVDPDNPYFLHNTGSFLRDLGRPDEAVPLYEAALRVKPDYAQAYANMGDALEMQGKIDAAINCYQKALELDPNDARVHVNMSNALEIRGEVEEAIVCLQRACELAPTNLSIKHRLSALTGVKTEGAPSEYVRGLFDYNAQWFEQRLVEKLEYRTPKLLKTLLKKFTSNEARFRNAVDLGCGTGLSGTEFRAISDRLTGVDISEEMIKQAKEKKIYDDLYVSEIIEFLKGSTEEYDLFIASDVLNYFGDLEPVFAAVRDCSRNGALFIFSTESHDGDGYVLHPSGRYAHAAPHVELQARDQGHELVVCSKERTRREDVNGPWVMGDLFVLQCALR